MPQFADSKPIQDIIRHFERKAPSQTAEIWDSVGLLVGDPTWQTKGAVVSIDLTSEAIEAALQKGFKLIINHHPCIFPGGPKGKGLPKVTPPSLVFDALTKGIAVFATHTNFDKCALEVVTQVAGALQVKPLGRLIDASSEELLKLIAFVPETHLEQVREAVCEAGSGHIGNYDQCSFSAPGQGTFRALDGANPFLGKLGTLEKAQEARLETVFPRGLKSQVLEALFKAHPYEEVAYDLIALEQAPVAKGLTAGLGYGFFGDFLEPKSFPELLQSVKSLFNVDGFLVTKAVNFAENQHVKKIGFVAGKGSAFLDAAAQAGCDVFITGEVGYHSALAASRNKMSVLELGHRESELFFLKTAVKWIEEEGLQVMELNLPVQRVFTGQNF